MFSHISLVLNFPALQPHLNVEPQFSPDFMERKSFLRLDEPETPDFKGSNWESDSITDGSENEDERCLRRQSAIFNFPGSVSPRKRANFTYRLDNDESPSPIAQHEAKAENLIRLRSGSI
jgi:hypothetical protein